MTAVERPAPPPVRTHKDDRRWVGKSIRKVEDPKFLRGRGGYIADLIRPGMLQAAVLRSPMPHARIVSIDTSAAEAAPGVHLVMTGAQAAEVTGPLPDVEREPTTHTWRCLAVDQLR